MRLGNLVTLIAGYEIAVNHNLHYVLLHSVKVEERLRYIINLKAEISVHNKMVQCKRLITAVCFPDKQELAFRGHDKLEKTINSR
jgi:hypothetical protein